MNDLSIPLPLELGAPMFRTPEIPRGLVWQGVESLKIGGFVSRIFVGYVLALEFAFQTRYSYEDSFTLMGHGSS